MQLCTMSFLDTELITFNLMLDAFQDNEIKFYLLYETYVIKYL